MSRLTDALAVFVNAEAEYREAVKTNAGEAVETECEQKCARAGEAYETALAQFVFVHSPDPYANP